MDFFFRDLTPEDANAYLSLRLYSLSESPFSFRTSFEDLIEVQPTYFEEEIRSFRNNGEALLMGVYTATDRLVGFGSMARDNTVNSRHKATVHSMYLHPDYRGLGLGCKLMEAMINRSKNMDGLEQIHLCVLHNNEGLPCAASFYNKLGFVNQGPLIKRDQKIKGRYLDAQYLVLYLDQIAQN